MANDNDGNDHLLPIPPTHQVMVVIVAPGREEPTPINANKFFALRDVDILKVADHNRIIQIGGGIVGYQYAASDEAVRQYFQRNYWKCQTC